MDYGKVKNFKVEKLKWFSCFTFQLTLKSITKDDIMKRQQRENYWIIREDDICYCRWLTHKMRQICVDCLMRYLNN